MSKWFHDLMVRYDTQVAQEEIHIPAGINPYDKANDEPLYIIFNFGYCQRVRGKVYNNPAIDPEFIEAFKAGYNHASHTPA